MGVVAEGEKHHRSSGVAPALAEGICFQIQSPFSSAAAQID
jgi:hypothetical protein